MQNDQHPHAAIESRWWKKTFIWLAAYAGLLALAVAWQVKRNPTTPIGWLVLIACVPVLWVLGEFLAALVFDPLTTEAKSKFGAFLKAIGFLFALFSLIGVWLLIGLLRA